LLEGGKMSETTGVKLEEHALYCIHHPEQVLETGQNKAGKMFTDMCPKCRAELEQWINVCV